MRRSSIPRRSRSRAIPGMRTCRTCGTFYTRHALLCPHCFPSGGADLVLSKALQRNHVVAAGAPVILAFPSPPPRPAPIYPEWVGQFSDGLRRYGYDTFKLSRILERMRAKGATPPAVDCVRAVIYYRFREPLPEVLDPGAEAVARDWMERP